MLTALPFQWQLQFSSSKMKVIFLVKQLNREHGIPSFINWINN